MRKVEVKAVAGDEHRTKHPGVGGGLAGPHRRVERAMSDLRLRRVGRVSAGVAIIGFATLFSLYIPGVNRYLSSSALWLDCLSGIGAIGSLAAFASWGMAIFHWGTYYRGTRKAPWGVAIILGAFVGAWIYWFAGGGSSRGR